MVFVECSLGFIGVGCFIKCFYLLFGENCLRICLCLLVEFCDFIFGCFKCKFICVCGCMFCLLVSIFIFINVFFFNVK